MFSFHIHNTGINLARLSHEYIFIFNIYYYDGTTLSQHVKQIKDLRLHWNTCIEGLQCISFEQHIMVLDAILDNWLHKKSLH